MGSAWLDGEGSGAGLKGGDHETKGGVNGRIQLCEEGPNGVTERSLHLLQRTVKSPDSYIYIYIRIYLYTSISITKTIYE